MLERSSFRSLFAARLVAARLIIIAVTLVSCIAITSFSFADVPNAQYVNIAPLPGAGVALNSHGVPDGLGAFQINIPVAYTPGWGYAGLGVFEGGLIDQSGLNNGSGVLGAGFGEWPKLYISAMQVSDIWSESKAVSAQLAVVPEHGNTPAVAIGDQDILRKEIGQRAPYGVMTKELSLSGRPIFATLGYGTGRFLNSPFGGLSAPIGNNLNVAVEWDGWQMNTGVGWRPGGRSGKLTLLAAYNGQVGPLLGATVVTWFGH